MDDDAALIQRFVRDGSEEAFRVLVERHLGLVYCAALRQLGGDAHRAKDVTQAVFCELVARARSLSGHPSLAGWLYKTAGFMASRLRRSDERRKERETKFTMNESEQRTDAGWSEVEPLIDEAMRELGGGDREALVLRYFENQTLKSVGTLLKLSEDGARMRVNRALERLRSVLEARGVKSSSGVLGALVAAHAVTAPPVALGGAVAGAALAVGVGGSSAGLGIVYFMASTKLKIAATGIALALAGAGYVWQEQQEKFLRKDLAEAHRRITELESRPEKSLVAVPAATSELSRPDYSELLRLRGEVTQLREELAKKSSESRGRDSGGSELITAEQRKEITRLMGLANLNYSRNLGLALHLYAVANDGKMPPGLAEAAAYMPPIPPELEWIHGMTGAQNFEIVYRGSLNDVTNHTALAALIIAREKQPFSYDSSGAASRTYLFADGHSEIHRAPNGDFEPWERERMMPPPGINAP